MKCSLNWRATVAAVLAIFTATGATAQDQKAAERKIVDRIAAGGDASAMIGQYLQAHPSTGSPRLDRAATLRQLQGAEANLASALQSWKGKGSPEAAAAAYREWQGAALLMAARHRSVESKLAGSEEGSAYVAAQRGVSDTLKARREQVVKLLDPLLAPKQSADKSAAREAPKDNGKAIAEALALLQAAAPKKTSDNVLHALNLPVGGLNLASRAPILAPVVTPAYASQADAAGAPEDSAAAPEGALSQEIVAKAEELGNDYVRIYEYVRNNTKTTWYAGAVQGAVGTLRSGSGNDVDQAALLVALLRAASLPTRYVHGVIELPLEKVAQDLGLPDPAQVPAALAKAGVAFSGVARGGKQVAVALEHTWVTARVPYTNYRGAMVDASGKTWIPLDPSYKASSWSANGLSLTDLGGAAALQEAYLAKPGSESFAEFVKRRGTDLLQSRSGAAADFDAALGRQTLVPLNLSLLPNSLPYTVVAVTSEEARLGDAYIVKARIKLASAGRTVLATDLPLYQALNQRVSLTYQPASLEDHRLSLLMGGQDAVPLYLIKLRPQLALGGHVLARASEGLSAGSDLKLDVEFAGPFGSQRVTQTLATGGNQVLVMAGNAVTRPGTAEAGDADSQAMRLLDGVGVAYARAWTQGEDQLAALAGARAVRPVPSLLIVTDRFDTLYHGQTPYTLEWKGVTMDALSHPVDAVGSGARDFLQLSGLHGSSLEAAVPGRQFSVDAVSADQVLAQAKARKVALLRLDNSNLAQLDATSHTEAVKDSVRNLARLGYRIDIPSGPLNVAGWSGSGWRAIDHASGASGYFLSGGIHGGATATEPKAWTLSFLAAVLAAQNGHDANADASAVRTLLKLGVGDGQTGTAGQVLDQPLSVAALDADGIPVVGAAVTFRVGAGGGTVGGQSSTTVLTNASGIASVQLTLGQNTADNAYYTYINPDDQTTTRVSQHLVYAEVASERGAVHIDVPFDATARPDKLTQLVRTSAPVEFGMPALWGDTLGIKAADQFGNPLANIDVSARMDSVRVCESDQADKYFRPGALFNGAFTGPERCDVSSPVLGECGKPSINLSTVSDGTVALGVILSNDAAGLNVVTASAAGVKQTATYKGALSCGEREVGSHFGWISVIVEGGITDNNGNWISAALPGKEYKQPVTATVMHAQYNWEVRSSGGKPILYTFPFVKHERQDADNVVFTVSNGGMSNGTTHVGKGLYETKVTVGPSPALNRVNGDASMVVEYPIISNNALSMTRIGLYNTTPSWTTVFSVQPKITDVTPKDAQGQIALDNRNRSEKPLSIEFEVAPREYRTTEVDVDLYENNTMVGVIRAAVVDGKGKALVPRGMAFEPGKVYQAQLVLNRDSKVELRSERVTLPTRPRLISHLHATSPSLEVDEINNRSCDINGTTTFGFNSPVVAKLEIQSLGVDGKPVGAKRSLFANKSYEAGDFDLPLPAGEIGTGDFLMTLSAVSAADPGLTDSTQSGFGSQFQRSNPLPVGQVLVHGVKVRDGTLTVQPYPLSEPGRGPSMRFQPTYSTGVNGQLGPMGMNWGHNWDSGVHINRCGNVVVSGGDSGNVVFFPDAKGGLTPAKGYHSTLVRDGNDFDFFSKDGTQYHYGFVDERNQWKLMSVKDSNGNALTLTYDMQARPAPLLKTVTANDGRMLKFDYADAVVTRRGWSEKRALLRAVSGPGVAMDFKYDDFGNLVQASGNGRSEGFDYKVNSPDFNERNQLIGYTDPNGRKTTYEYTPYELKLNLPNGGMPFAVPQTVVSKVVTPTGPIRFDYEIGNFTKTTVTNQNGKTTDYELNPFGSPLKIIDGAGTTSMTWATDDIQMLSKVDPRGIETIFAYDAAGNLASETVGGKAIKRSYLIQTQRPYIKDKLLEETDRNQHTTKFGRDNKGNLITIDNPDGGKITKSYSDAGDLLSSVDARGGATTYRYDAKGNLVGVTDPLGATTLMDLNERGQVIRKTDALGHGTTYEVDLLDRITSRTNAKGGVSTFTYDKVGNKLSEKDEEGNSTTWEYSPHDHPVKETRADGSSKTMGYDDVGNKTWETDYRGNKTTFAYDAANRLTLRTEPLGRETTYGYDGVGHVTSEKDGLGRTTTHAYDALGFRTGTTDAAGGSWTMERDNVGNLLSTTDPEGRTTSNSYDAMNRLVTVTRPIGSLGYAYDKNGNRTRETDARGNATKFEYDAGNRLINRIDADGKVTTSDYDKVGNLIKVVDPRLSVTLYSYDELNRKIDLKDAEGYVTTFRYDGLGNLVGQTEPNGNAISHTYDKLDRRTASYDKLGKLGAWDYDADGNVLSQTDANGNATTHDYNALGQLKASHQPEGRDLVFEVDLMGNRTGLTDGRGNKTTYEYDKLNRVILSKDAKGYTHVFEYDKVGNKTRETDPLSHSTTTQYDALNRPVLVTDALNQVLKFEYDDNGNKTKETDKRGIATTHVYDKLNRVTSTTRDG
ncbi:transglutaminase domain-containing protein, partial [Pseudoduganella violaceinigra]|uniref:transglutaminase domain-containing protein n=1 Tax=Pseudoduganella violaceinigra TaxID=246602 RepID=UPI0005534F96